MWHKELKTEYTKRRFIRCLVLFVFMVVLYFSIKKSMGNTDGLAVILDKQGNEIKSLDVTWIDYFNQSDVIMEDVVIDSIIRELFKVLSEEGMSEEKIKEGLNQGGWKIHTTIDSTLQDMLDIYYADSKKFTLTGKAGNEGPPSSMIIIDYTGNVRALAVYNGSGEMKNRAISELYQVGSTIKPVSIYAPAIANKLIHYSSLCEDTPGNIVIGQKNVQWPSNYDNHYDGKITVEYALATSKNTIPVNLGMQMGEEYIYKYLSNSYFSTLVDGENDESDKQLAALALGYFAKGISLDELAASYEPFGNGGDYYAPTICAEVTDRNGNTFYERMKEQHKIMDSETAYIMNRLLINNVYGQDGIAKGARIEGVEVAGKTGTVASGEMDERKLFVGMTPDYIAAVQVGYDVKNMPLQGDVKQPIHIWQELMSKILFKEEKFEKESNVIELEFCEKTGKLRGNDCKEWAMGYYSEDNMPVVCIECGGAA